VSIDCKACCKQLKLLASYNKILIQLLVRKMECCSLDQEESYLQLQVLVLETYELFTTTDTG